MPYVNLPRPQLQGAIAKIVGKMQGTVVSKVVESGTKITNSLNRQGCPTPNQTARLRKQLDQNKNSLQKVQSRLNKFKSLPGKIKAPLGGLKAALKIILTLPIPQGVGIPPGPAGGLILGLPINITTKYADTMHLLKEFISQIDEIVIALEAVMTTPSNTLKSVGRNIGAADTAVKCCEVEAALKGQLDEGNIAKSDLDELGLLDDDGEMIFSTLGPKLLAKVSNAGLTNSSKDSLKNKSDLNNRGKWYTEDDGSGSDGQGRGIAYKKDDKVKYKDIEYICLKDHLSSQKNAPPTKEFWGSLDPNDPNNAINSSVNSLLDGLRKLNDSNINKDTKDIIRGLLDNFKDIGKGDRQGDSKFFHTGPNGIVYELQIKKDPTAPPIAPRRFAVAIDPNGAEMFKGPKSFASQVEVLLEEIKFRIDNQLS
jgi:hypothetical protein